MKTHNASCATVPEFTRLKFFYGQMLGVQDFQKEQDYFREKMKLHNRCLHGYGTVCGLEVVPEPVDPSCEPDTDSKRAELQKELDKVNQQIKDESSRADKELQELNSQAGKVKEQLDKTSPSSADYDRLQEELDGLNKKIREFQQKLEDNLRELRARAEELTRELEALPKDCVDEKKQTSIWIECGLALDCEGNELVVRQPLKIDLRQALRCDGKYQETDEPRTVYVSICYCEQPVDPVRPVLPDSCGASSACTYGKVRDSVHVKVTTDPPEPDERCETCCEACADPCLLLARIEGFVPGRPVTPEQIHNDVRRLIGPYTMTTITGINWTHGAEYTPRETADLLGMEDTNGGLLIRFSRPVLVSTLRRGVIDLWVIRGGKGEAGDAFYMEGEIITPANATMTDTVRYRQTTDETLNPGDRLVINVRTSFILDKCCRPVNGMHVGGRVPILPEFRDRFYRGEAYKECEMPPHGYGPWTTNGSGSFESWTYVKRAPKYGAEESR